MTEVYHDGISNPSCPLASLGLESGSLFMMLALLDLVNDFAMNKQIVKGPYAGKLHHSCEPWQKVSILSPFGQTLSSFHKVSFARRTEQHWDLG